MDTTENQTIPTEVHTIMTENPTISTEVATNDLSKISQQPNFKLLTYPRYKKELRTKLNPITQEQVKTPEFKNNLNKMAAYFIDKKNIIGLSAIQIGWNVPLFLLQIGENMKIGEMIKVYINPKITEYSKETAKELEGCLSFPGLMLNIERPKSIKYEYEDIEGKKYSGENNNYYSKAFQHETDHTNGVLFIDRINNNSVENLKVERWIKKMTMMNNKFKKLEKIKQFENAKLKRTN